jgi:hypothetical protein
MSVSYDPSVIEQFAQRLYRRATWIVAQYAILGLVVLPAAVSVPFILNRDGIGAPELMVVAAVGGLIGFLIGREKGFNLRLQAQVALCQVQIERNTRGAAASALAS